MKIANEKRTRIIGVRFSTSEYAYLETKWKKTTCRKLSEYARKNLLQKPIILKYRNESMDEMILKLIQLKNDLNSIGNNYNQSVKKLHTISDIPEFRNWILAHEAERDLIFTAIHQIQNQMHLLTKKWLQS